MVWESADGRQARGIWQITPGVVTDTEADEVFVVLSGSATVEIEGGPTLRVGPGDMAVLREGDRTTGRSTRRCARCTPSTSEAVSHEAQPLGSVSL